MSNNNNNNNNNTPEIPGLTCNVLGLNFRRTLNKRQLPAKCTLVPVRLENNLGLLNENTSDTGDNGQCYFRNQMQMMTEIAIVCLVNDMIFVCHNKSVA